MGPIVKCRIHPGIGIARVGNSPAEFFVGPEIPNHHVAPSGGYKDEGDPVKGVPPRVKRQAARFRVYGYDASGSLVGEVTASDAVIQWTVHLVNSKAASRRFTDTRVDDNSIAADVKGTQRNAGIEDRASLIIDPGPRAVSGPRQRAVFSGGTFRGIDVPLGDIRTDEDGRLLVLGGFGKAGSSKAAQPLTHYADNDFWFDDVSDGPVQATVRFHSGDALDAEPAWVIVAPPDFAPEVTNLVTLYDVVLDTALRDPNAPKVADPRKKPSFTNDVAPIFRRLADMNAVQQGGRAADVPDVTFDDIDALAEAGDADRKAIADRFRNPHLTGDAAKAQANANFLPVLSGDAGDAAPGEPALWLTVTRTQYDVLQAWAKGDFRRDWQPGGAGPEAPITPDGLDRAALEACSGGPFYPGIEAGRPLRDPRLYAGPFRLSPALKPGDITRGMACPWQADYFECHTHWWPAQRPDEVLTLPVYQRLRQIDEQLAQSPGADERKQLEAERAQLFDDRTSWARGLPGDLRAGRLAMVSQWPQHGFVASGDQDGEPFTLDGDPVFVETERGRFEGLSMPEYFHILVNIEQHPDFLPKAKEIARAFFEKADFEQHENYQPFRYTPEAFDRRLRKIYDEMALNIDARSRMDTGLITWPVVVRKEGDREFTEHLEFDVGRFSDRVVKERIRQKAPFNLIDGAWLQRIQTVGPSDEIRANLSSIWNDEAGNGVVSQNHANVYDSLLRSVNIFLPPITSKRFTEMDFLADAFVQPVFQLSVSLFPEEFFPELLGMTLYQEWEATPAMTQGVTHLRERQLDPHFYALHVSIDNITAGHAFLAKEAIKLYLQKAEDEGGSVRVAKEWERIWRGYVTWATAGGLGLQLLELCLLIDRKRIDVSYAKMLLPDQVKPEVIRRLAAAAAGGTHDPLSASLVAAFRDGVRAKLLASGQPSPDDGLRSAVVDELNWLVRQGVPVFTREQTKGLLKADTEKLFGEEREGEELVELNRLLLRDVYDGLIDDIPTLPPRWFPDVKQYFKQRFVDLIKKKAYAARPLHTKSTVGGHNLATLFDDPERLIVALEGSDEIDKKHPRDSRLIQLTEFGRPMYKIFTSDEIDVMLDWIESLTFEDPVPKQPVNPEEWPARVLAFLKAHAAAVKAIPVHRQELVQSRSVADWVDDPLALMNALRESPAWVVPHNSGGSRLCHEFGSGEMASIGAREFDGVLIADLFRRWVDTGAGLPAPPPPPSRPLGVQRRAPRDAKSPPPLTFPDAPPGAGGAGTATDLDRRFAARRKLIGMGCVH